MNKKGKDILEALKAFNKILQEKKQDYERTIEIINNEIRQLKDKYINLYSNLKIGDHVLYTSFTGIEKELIIHDINVRMTGTISYDIGDESSIMYKDISCVVLKRTNEKN